MNIRLDNHSIRIRVSQDEVLILAQEKKLIEYIPALNLNLNISISQEGDTGLVFKKNAHQDLEFEIPKDTDLNSDQNIELSSKLNINGKMIDVLFEVDRFTRKKVKS